MAYRTRMFRVLSAALALGLAACATPKPATRDPSPPPTPALVPGASLDPAAAASYQEALALGQQGWDRRETREGLESALAAWSRAAELGPREPGPLECLAQGYHFLADAHLRRPELREEAQAAFERGAQAGEKALSLRSPALLSTGEPLEQALARAGKESVPALYWTAVNLLRARPFSAGDGQRQRAYLERALQLEPGYQQAGPHRALGTFLATAPVFAGGDLERARQHFDQALQLAPAHLGTRVALAEHYCPRKPDRALFQQQLELVQQGNPGSLPALAPELKVEQVKAAELRARADELF